MAHEGTEAITVATIVHCMLLLYVTYISLVVKEEEEL